MTVTENLTLTDKISGTTVNREECQTLHTAAPLCLGFWIFPMSSLSQYSFDRATIHDWSITRRTETRYTISLQT